MLEVTRLRDHRDSVAAGYAKRGLTTDQLDAVVQLDDRRKQLQAEVDAGLANIKHHSRSIGELMRTGQREQAEQHKAQVAETKVKLEPLRAEQASVMEQLETLLLELPNVPHASVPEGRRPEDNEVFRAAQGPEVELGEHALPHWDLGERYGLFDMELGVKLAGSGFVVYRGDGARLQRALIQFFLDRAQAAGYEEIAPPHLVNATTARGTGALPDKEGQMYHVTEDGFYLIPTAEVPVTNLVRDELLDAERLPLAFTSYTPCFRREAGSYGKEVRGLNRVHQFDKVEIVRIEHPDKSYAALDGMLDHVSELLRDLNLRFRVLRLCGGDMSFASALTYDFEVWSPAQKRWLEVSSVSNFETFQSNRLNLRVRDEDGSKQLAHTLNGSALALPRIMAALLEQNQGPQGIALPEVLRPYFGGRVSIPSV